MSTLKVFVTSTKVSEALELDLQPRSTVADLKSRIAELWQVPQSCQELIANATNLRDAELLATRCQKGANQVIVTLHISLDRISQDLEHRAPQTRQNALAALAQMGPRGGEVAVDLVAQRLHKDKDPDVRYAALQALSRVAEAGDERAIAAASARLADKDSGVKHVAVEVVTQLGQGCESAVIAVSEQLAHRDATVRGAASRALVQVVEHGDENAVLAAIERLGHQEANVRRAAAKALAKACDNGSDYALVALHHCTNHQDPIIKRVAADALKTVPDLDGRLWKMQMQHGTEDQTCEDAEEDGPAHPFENNASEARSIQPTVPRDQDHSKLQAVNHSDAEVADPIPPKVHKRAEPFNWRSSRQEPRGPVRSPPSETLDDAEQGAYDMLMEWRNEHVVNQAVAAPTEVVSATVEAAEEENALEDDGLKVRLGNMKLLEAINKWRNHPLLQADADHDDVCTEDDPKEVDQISDGFGGRGALATEIACEGDVMATDKDPQPLQVPPEDSVLEDVNKCDDHQEDDAAHSAIPEVDDDDWRSRHAALESLVVQDAETSANRVEIACAHLEDSSERVRQMAVEVLAEIAEKGDPVAIGAATKRLDHKMPHVRKAALEALAAVSQRGDEAVVANVIRCLADHDAQIRQIALEALADVSFVGDLRAIIYIRTRMEDPNVSIRRIALESLVRVAGKSNSCAIDAVIERLKDADVGVRRDALQALPQLAEPGNERAMLAASTFLRDSCEEMRTTALQVLTELRIDGT